jgi:polyphosphate glucokinase
MQVLGIDVGGSGIKGAPVDTETGELLAERIRIKTPKSAEPQPIADVVAEIARNFNYNGPIGIGFPAPIKASVAEMKFGAGRGQRGTVIMLTLGTGIGSAIFHAGKLLPNTEFGHLDMDGKDAEHRASALVRERDGLSWKKYARRLNEYLLQMEKLFWPDLFIIGGGISKESDKYIPLLTVETPVETAQLFNEAGIVGAALAARTGS